MLKSHSFKIILSTWAILAAPWFIEAEIAGETKGYSYDKNIDLSRRALTLKSNLGCGNSIYTKKEHRKLKLKDFAGSFAGAHNSVGGEGTSSVRLIESLHFDKKGSGEVKFRAFAVPGASPGDIISMRATSKINVEIEIIDPKNGVAVLTYSNPRGETKIDVVVERSKKDGRVVGFQGVVNGYPLLESETYVVAFSYIRQWQD